MIIVCGDLKLELNFQITSCQCGRDKSGSELVQICIGRKRIRTGFEPVWHFASVDRPLYHKVRAIPNRLHFIHLWATVSNVIAIINYCVSSLFSKHVSCLLSNRSKILHRYATCSSLTLECCSWTRKMMKLENIKPIPMTKMKATNSPRPTSMYVYGKQQETTKSHTRRWIALNVHVYTVYFVDKN